MKTVFILLFLNLYAFSAEKTYGNAVVDSVISIYDGDTFTVTLKNKSWPPIIRERIGIRIDGVDCPEMTDKQDSVKALARKAKEITVGKLRSAKSIKLVDIKRDKYFRIVARVIVDGVDLGALLIQSKVAKAYDGGTKEIW